MKKQKDFQRLNSQCFNKLRHMIQNGYAQRFQREIMKYEIQIIKGFLFYQDQIGKTSIMMMTQSSFYKEFLTIINQITKKKIDQINQLKQIKNDNQFYKKNQKIKYINWNKILLEKCHMLLTQNNNLNELIILLAEESSIYYCLSQDYLNLDNVLQLLNGNKSKFDLLQLFFIEFIKKSNLNITMANPCKQIQIYNKILKRDIIWSNLQNLIGAINKNINAQNLDLLTLRELNYNCLHEISRVSSKQFLKLCTMIQTTQIFDQSNKKYIESLFLQINSQKRMVSDICLNTWQFNSIITLLQLMHNNQYFYLTTNCLNMIIYNRNLNKQQRQLLIYECLHGKISQKGYAKINTQFRRYKLKNGRQLKLKKYKYNFTICYNNNQIKKQKDSSGAYPLLLYLRLYRHQSKLSILEGLFLPELNKKLIKRQYLILLKIVSDSILPISKNTKRYDQIVFFYQLYQPLWKQTTRLQHGQIMSYLISKLYLSCYEMKIWQYQTSKQDNIRVQMASNHFLKYLIENNNNKQQNEINRFILRQILQIKNSYKDIGEYQLNIKLIIFLSDVDIFYSSKDYLILTLRNYLKKYVKQMTDGELQTNFYLMNYLVKPIYQKKQYFLITVEQIVERFGLQNMIACVEGQEWSGKSQFFEKFFQETKLYIKKQVKIQQKQIIRDNNTKQNEILPQSQQQKKQKETAEFIQQCRRNVQNMAKQIISVKQKLYHHQDNNQMREKFNLKLKQYQQYVQKTAQVWQMLYDEDNYWKRSASIFYQINCTHKWKPSYLIDPFLNQLSLCQQIISIFSTKHFQRGISIYKQHQPQLLKNIQKLSQKKLQIKIRILPLSISETKNYLLFLQQMSFTFQCKILDFAKQCYFQTCKQIDSQFANKKHQQQENYRLDQLQSYRADIKYFIRQIYKSVNQHNRVAFYLIIQKELFAIPDFIFLKKFINLKSTENWNLITARFILLDNSRQDIFFAKEETVIKYSNWKFYYKCQEKTFDVYLDNLSMYHKESKFLRQNLKIAIKNLIIGEKWDRIFKLLQIKELTQLNSHLFFIQFYESFNRQKHLTDITFKKLIKQMFEVVEHSPRSNKIDDNLFISMSFIDFKKTFQIFKPRQLNLRVTKTCLTDNPAISSLLIQKNVLIKTYKDDQMNQKNEQNQEIINVSKQKDVPLWSDYKNCEYLQKRMKNNYQILPEYSANFYKYPWMVDYFRVKLSLAKHEGVQHHFINTIRCLFNRIELLPYKDEIFNNFGKQYYNKNICSYLIKCSPQIHSLELFQSYTPELSQLMKSCLFSNQNSLSKSKKGKCLNLQRVNRNLLIEMLQNGYLSPKQQENMYSAFIRFIERCDLQLIQSFLKKNNLQININFCKRLQQLFSLGIWPHLLRTNNQLFIVNFIQKYNMFKLSKVQEYSQLLLNAICSYRWNYVLQFTIKYFEKLINKKLIFKSSAQLENKAKITQNGTFIMPVDISKDNSFYQVYFLIIQSGNKCQRFNISSRFLMVKDSKQWNYFNNFKRRVDINNQLLQNLNIIYYKNRQQLQFKLNTIIKPIFQLQQNYIECKQTNLKKFNYSQSLSKFIGDLTNNPKQIIYKLQTMGIFQKIYLMYDNQHKTKIPIRQFQKQYQKQIKIIIKIAQFISKSHMQLTIKQIFTLVPEYKPLLFIYNPQQFVKNEQFIQDMFGQGKSNIIDYYVYMRGMQINLIYLQQHYPNIIFQYILKYFIKYQEIESSQTQQIKQEEMNQFTQYSYLIRNILIFLLVDLTFHNRQLEQCFAFQFVLDSVSWKIPKVDDVLYQISRKLNIRSFNEVVFDITVWQKMFDQVFQIQLHWKTRLQLSMLQYDFSMERMQQLISSNIQILLKQFGICSEIIGLNEVFEDLYDYALKRVQNKGIYVELNILMNMCNLQQQFKNLQTQMLHLINLFQDKQLNIKIIINRTNKIKVNITQDGDLQIMMNYYIKQKGKYICLLDCNFQEIFKYIRLQVYHFKIQINPNVSIAIQNNYIDGNFKYNVESIKKIQQLTWLQLIMKESVLKYEGLLGKIALQIQKLGVKLQIRNCLKLYDASDLYGPINIEEQTDLIVIKDNLSFYDIVLLPQHKQIQLRYIDKEIIAKQKNILRIKHIKHYFEYYIRSSKQQNVPQFEFDNMIQFYITTNQQTKLLQIHTQYSALSAYNIYQFYSTVYNFCNHINNKIQKYIEVRLSLYSLLNYCQAYFQMDQQINNKQMLEMLLHYNSIFMVIVQRLVMMISCDILNIMKVMRGLLIKFQINKKYSQQNQQNYIILSQECSLMHVDYVIKDQVLHVIFYIKIFKDLNKQKYRSNIDNLTKIINRRLFLGCIFTNAQFLTDYFIMKQDLNLKCTQISTKLSKSLNTLINFHIQYKNLYQFINKIIQTKNIKQIQNFLVDLKDYLLNNMQYILQKQVCFNQLTIIKHQIYLITKCESIIKNKNIQQIINITQLQYKIQQNKDQYGIVQIDQLINKFKHKQNNYNNNKIIQLQNNFLIQINKYYLATIITEGMILIIGYKQKQIKIVHIKSTNDKNNINVNQISYVLIVTKIFPSSQHVKYNKIIRLFITDCDCNVYKFNDKIKQYFFQLPIDSQDRNASYFAPSIPSNIKLQFYTKQSQIQKDKQLIEDDGYGIIKNKSNKSSKKNKRIQLYNIAFKVLNQKFTSQNIILCIDVPNQLHRQWSINHLFDIIKSISLDIVQILNKIQLQPLRNIDLDYKLSIQKGFNVNKNSIIQCRRLLFVKHFKKLRIKIRDDGKVLNFDEKELCFQISMNHPQKLSSSTELLNQILLNLIEKQLQLLPVNVKYKILKKDGLQTKLKYLDILNIIPYQLQQLQLSKQLIKLFFNKDIKKYNIEIGYKKSQILFINNNNIQINFNIQSSQRQFYSCENIVNQYLCFMKKQQISLPDTNIISYYCFDSHDIVLPSKISNKFIIAIKNQKQKLISISENARQQNDKLKIKITHNIISKTKYFAYHQDSGYVFSNYFYEIDKQLAIDTKYSRSYRFQVKHLYVENQNYINCNFQDILITETDNYNKSTTFELFSNSQKHKAINVQLISKNVYKLAIKSEKSMVLKFNLKKNKNLLKRSINSLGLTICSNGQVSLNNTKFVCLQSISKDNKLNKIPIDPLKKNKNNQESCFQENVEEFAQEEIKRKDGDFKNIENLVYIVSPDSRKYLTKVGQTRIDYFKFCDSQDNPLQYQIIFQAYLKHINNLDCIKPQIIKNKQIYGVKWCPTIRGNYQLFINNVKMNPPYEIGVHALQPNLKKSIFHQPKIKAINFYEEVEIKIDLKDDYGNLYSQIQQQIMKDSLGIQIQSNNLQESLKVKQKKADKYGSKSILFSFDIDSGPQDLLVKVIVNKNIMMSFMLSVIGCSLEQRKKSLEKDIELLSKLYGKTINIRRDNFLQEIMKISKTSMYAKFSIVFNNEPGIDAGGLKRQFYDMIGSEMKNKKNPFFTQINSKTMEYFLNPQILKNKKRTQYMQMWGKYLANSILNGYLIGIKWSHVFLKLIYDQEINFKDLFQILPQQQIKGYQYLLSADPSEFQDFGLYFSIVIDKNKSLEWQLKQNGKNIEVNHQNFKQYLELTAQYLIVNRYKQIIQAFKIGFQSVLPLTIIKKWIRSSEFWCLTSGNKETTPELVLKYVIFKGNQIQQHAGWFRRFIHDSSGQLLIGFLKFSTGSSSINFNFSSKIVITFIKADKNTRSLPISHTCFYQIDIPKYNSYETMKQLMTTAFLYANEGFGFG